MSLKKPLLWILPAVVACGLGSWLTVRSLAASPAYDDLDDPPVPALIAWRAAHAARP